jgi:uncharacterized protein (TIGR02118 family)
MLSGINPQHRSKPMSGVVLTVLYPHPTDTEAFNEAYVDHIALLHEKAGIPTDQKPYTLLRFAPGPDGPAPYYQMFSTPFPSADAFVAAMATPEMQEVAADSARISTGGTPQILVGTPA